MIDYLTRNQEKLVVVDGEKICAACGSAKVLNIALLGAACAAGALGNPKESFQKAIESRLPQKFVTMNLKALERRRPGGEKLTLMNESQFPGHF